MYGPTQILRSAAAVRRLRQPSREAVGGGRRPSRWWFSTTPPLSTSSAGRSSGSSNGNNKLPLLLVSRRALLQQKQKQKQQHPSSNTSTSGGAKPRAHGTQANKNAAEEKPWPRSAVLGFYAACGVLVPYCFAWFLASQESWRTALLGDDGGDVVEEDEQEAEPTTAAALRPRILQGMRRHFGEIDFAALSEPERLELEHRQWNNSGGPAAAADGMIVPHKFLDEPTAAVRRQQARVARQNRQTNLLPVRWHRPPWEQDGGATLAELPAATPANPEAVRRALGLPERALVALDFPVGKENHSEMQEEEEGNATVLSDGKENEDGTSTPESNPSMSIYSLWHHHSAPQADDNAAASSDSGSASSSSSHRRMSPAQLELSRLDHEIAQLKEELMASGSRSHRAIDDIRHDLQQKQSERRRWQIKRWLGR